MRIAATIRQQLGGAKFEALTGAKNFASSGNDLQFKLGTFAGVKVRYVKVTLMKNDLYRMDFFNRNCLVVATRENLYADQLQSTFTSVTGLDTRI
jgi:hypothetical protein